MVGGVAAGQPELRVQLSRRRLPRPGQAERDRSLVAGDGLPDDHEQADAGRAASLEAGLGAVVGQHAAGPAQDAGSGRRPHTSLTRSDVTARSAHHVVDSAIYWGALASLFLYPRAPCSSP